MVIRSIGLAVLGMTLVLAPLAHAADESDKAKAEKQSPETGSAKVGTSPATNAGQAGASGVQGKSDAGSGTTKKEDK